MAGATGKVAVEFTLQAVALEAAMDRGTFPHFNEAAIREILSTVARIGAIDDEVMGIQPKWNRLLLDPHLTSELNGTQLTHTLRGQRHDIALNVDDYRVTVDGLTLRSRGPFGVAVAAGHADYFHGASASLSLRVIRSGAWAVEVSIQTWSDGPRGRRTWTLSGVTAGMPVEQTVLQLAPGTEYRLRSGGGEPVRCRSDGQGRLPVRAGIETGTLLRFELEP